MYQKYLKYKDKFDISINANMYNVDTKELEDVINEFENSK
jgi:hypothetical protein